MTTYYCTTHRDEDLNTLVSEKLDTNTNHMVLDSGYDLDQLRTGLQSYKVIWEMQIDLTAKFGWKFKNLVGIPK